MSSDVLMTGTLRDAATLVADGVAHTFDVPALLRHAACTIDDLRTRVGDSLTGDERLYHGIDVAPRPFKVGDRVRFARFVGGLVADAHVPPLGMEGVVTANDGTHYIPIRVRCDGGFDGPIGNAWWFAAEALDLIATADEGNI